MTIEKHTQGTTVTLKINGWLDTQAVPMLQSEVNALDGADTELVIDCAGLEYISSAGLRLLVAAYKKVSGAMTLRHVSDEIMGIIKMTGLDKKMKIE